MKIEFSNKTKNFLVFAFFCLFLIIFACQDNKTKQIQRINSLSEINTLNEQKASGRELFLNSWSIIKSNYYNKDLNNQNWAKWKKRYLYQIKNQEDAYVAINTMLASLDDPYSKFMSEKEFQEQNSAINSKLYGIGINIASISGKIYIINVLPQAPAYNAGVQIGDIILKVNETDVKGQTIYDVARLIRGNVGDYINLQLLRGNQQLNKVVKREEIKVKAVEYKKLPNDIGYIRISSFIGADTPKEFIVALNRIIDSKALILDLRGNSGGLFQNAVLISNLFLKKGTIVQVIARNGKKNVYSAQDDGCIYDNPIVVLIDESCASAGEIFSSALQENNRATLIGTKTYGKGLVQKIYSMPNKSGMNLTIAKYLTPLGKDINERGIKPDYTVNFSHRDFLNNFDTQLNFAQNFLAKELAKKEL
ncbi:MAG: S41 family peptidase [Candidatus Gastranaerophilales bacterium]|nr:S41 family peptidase [Candidatus Gastranaerophilales bacterium]